MKSTEPTTAQDLNTQWRDHLPGHLGIVIKQTRPGEVQAELEVTARVSAPDGHLHAGTVLALAVHALALRLYQPSHFSLAGDLTCVRINGNRQARALTTPDVSTPFW